MHKQAGQSRLALSRTVAGAEVFGQDLTVYQEHLCSLFWMQVRCQRSRRGPFAPPPSRKWMGAQANADIAPTGLASTGGSHAAPGCPECLVDNVHPDIASKLKLFFV